MSKRSLATKAPVPVGLSEDVRTHARTTTPASTTAASTPSFALPPTSPKSGAVSPHFTAHHTHAEATEQQQQQQGSERPTTLPFITSAADGTPRHPVPQQQQQQQQRRVSVVRRISLTSESAVSSVSGSILPPSPSHCPPHGAATPVMCNTGALLPFQHSTTAPETRSPSSVTRPRLMSRPPTMNPSLFQTSATDAAQMSPYHCTPTDRAIHNCNNNNYNNGLSGIGSAAISPMAHSTTTTPAEPSRTNLILYNVAPHVTEEVLRELFEVYGNVVSCAVMRGIHTGESLGTAFVRFASTTEACRALHDFRDRTRPVPQNDDKPLVVQWARKQHDDNPVGEARRKIMKLFVRNIPLDCTVETLEMLFEQYGCVRQVTLHKDTAQVEDPAMERLIAFVIYTEEGAAERAATAVHNTKPFPSCYGIPVMIKLAESSQRKRYLRNADGATTSTATSPMAMGEGMGTTPIHIQNVSSPHAFDMSCSASSMSGSTGPYMTYGGGQYAHAAPSSFRQLPYPPQHQQSCPRPYAVPVLADNFPSSYQMPVTMDTPSLYAHLDSTDLVLTAEDYGMGDVAPYSATVRGSRGTTGNGADTTPQRSASYTRLPVQHHLHHQPTYHVPQQGPQRGPYNYEDMTSEDSPARGTESGMRDGGSGRANADSRSHSRSHVANSLDASLTGYGTDRASVSSKSATTSVVETPHSIQGGTVQAAPMGVRGTSSSYKPWLSANESITNISTHGAMTGCPTLTLGARAGQHAPYTTTHSGHTSGMPVRVSGNELEPSYGATSCTSPAQSGHGRPMESVSSPAMAPTVSGNGSVAGGNSTPTQYLLYPGKPHLSNGAGNPMTSASTAPFHTPAKTAQVVSSISISGSGLCGTSNDGSASSSIVFPQGCEASINWRRAVRSHAHGKRCGEVCVAQPGVHARSPGDLSVSSLAVQQPPPQPATQFSMPLCASDAIEVVPRATPPKTPAVSVNPRLSGVSAGMKGQSSAPSAAVNASSRSGSVNSQSNDSGASQVPAKTSCTRYYNNPYCAMSPKMYC